MRKILRHYVVDTLCLYLVSVNFSGMVFEKGVVTLLLAGVGLMLASLLVKPLVNILLIPLNLLTFGLFKWLSSAIALYLVTLVVPGFSIARFYFAGFASKWIAIPSISLGKILAFIAFSFLLSLISSVVNWLLKD